MQLFKNEACQTAYVFSPNAIICYTEFLNEKLCRYVSLVTLCVIEM